MAYIIAEPCLDVKDRACVDGCPVDCIYDPHEIGLTPADPDFRNMLFIHPEECIDCGVCEPLCPVGAIFPQEEVPLQWQEHISATYRVFGLTSP